MTIAAPSPVLDHDDGPELKEFLIFRLDTREGERELSNESALILEAERYADLMALSEGPDGMHDVHEVHYEVRCATTGGLLYTTGQ